jgi:hypothetical protein
VPAREALAITFVPLEDQAMRPLARGEARLDLGSVSAAENADGRRLRRTRVRRRIGIRIGAAGATARPVSLRAFLAADDGRVRVRVDGLPLSSVPRLIDPAVRTGVTSSHLIEIEVPESEPEGPFFARITWLAETD